MDEMKRKVQMLLQTRSEDEARMIWKLCSQSQWNYERAKKELADGGWRDQVTPILYRPFDSRWTVFNPNVAVHRRERVMRHMLAGENLGIAVGRAGQVVGPEEWNIVFCADRITEYNLYRRGGNNLFPLYLYPSAKRDDLFAHQEPTERRANLNPKLVAALAKAHGREPTSEEIFHYVYAVLYAPAYREKYAEFLRMDFPRVPLTADAGLFAELAALGARLTSLHLLKSPELDPPACRFEGRGDSSIAKGRKTGLRFESGEQRVYINATQYFAPVPEAVWTYRVGGYQVCEKWLKDRQDRRLELGDIQTYCRIVTALDLTLGIQQEINGLYPRAESKTVVFPEFADTSQSVRPTKRSRGRGKTRR